MRQPHQKDLVHIPVELARHTVESLYAEQGVQRPWIYWSVLVFCIGVLVALPLVKVDITVRAPGVVRPLIERTELKVAVSGRIAKVLVKDNERVTAGQSLLELFTRDPEERLARNRALQAEKNNIIADLEFLTKPVNAEGSVVLDAGQADLNDGQFHSLEYRQAYLQIKAQLDSNRVTLAKARADLSRFEALAGRELVTQSDLDAARYAVKNTQAQEQILIRQALNSWKSSLRTEKIDRDNLVSEEKRLVEEMTFSIVRAPVSGNVQSFLGFSEGAYLVAGQSLGYISPEAGLLIEASLSPRDIGLVQVGQAARLQIDAFPYTQWGLLDARVEQIAEDASINGQQLFFRVLLKPDKEFLSIPSGIKGTLRKGMTLHARFVINRRSLLQLLYEGSADWLNPQSG